MQRTTKKERKENAKSFWEYFENGGIKTAVVIERRDSTTNPNVNRTQFLAVCSLFESSPVVIAESASHGIEGCFYELLENIKQIYPQKPYWDDGFKDWLWENYKLKIAYNDGFVMMIER